MFFDSPSDITRLAMSTGTSIFVLPPNVNVSIKSAIILAPEEKSTITIEQVRSVIAKLSMKQTTDQFVIIRPAETLGEEAANAILKTLEEPGDKVHFVLITDSPSSLLPTILSRATLYILRTHTDFTTIASDDKIKALAKRFIAAKPADLPALAEEITKKKDGVRTYAISVIGTAIEMLYKSYFITEKTVFISKLPKFLALYDNLTKNGHIKLHLVADLI
ncbi:hypothetical protein IJG90_03400 [Candidatus Saccharibacteria bacterium]|nr:hypothetical protein [Candidatus Saccharibacteria bacterium]